MTIDAPLSRTSDTCPVEVGRTALAPLGRVIAGLVSLSCDFGYCPGTAVRPADPIAKLAAAQERR